MSETPYRTSAPSHYELLGIEADAPAAKVKAIFRLRTREAYPVRPGEGDTERQTALNLAYQVLRDPAERRAYNQALGLPEKPRAPRHGHTIYGEISVDESLAESGGTTEYTFYRQEPCGRCWGEGCDACDHRGHGQAKVKIPVKVRPGLDQILVEKQGAAAEPGGPRGDLILYVVVG